MNATAQAIYAHRHTVSYRLERVRELTGLDPFTLRGPRAAGARPQGVPDHQAAPAALAYVRSRLAARSLAAAVAVRAARSTVCSSSYGAGQELPTASCQERASCSSNGRFGASYSAQGDAAIDRRTVRPHRRDDCRAGSSSSGRRGRRSPTHARPDPAATCASGLGARAATVEDAADVRRDGRRGDAARGVRLDLPADALDGKVVVDAANYYPARDGTDRGVEHGAASTEVVARAPRRRSRVVKAFNTPELEAASAIYKPAGDAERRGHADRRPTTRTAKRTVSEHGRRARVDPVDAGDELDDSKRHSGASPAYGGATRRRSVRRRAQRQSAVPAPPIHIARASDASRPSRLIPAEQRGVPRALPHESGPDHERPSRASRSTAAPHCLLAPSPSWTSRARFESGRRGTVSSAFIERLAREHRRLGAAVHRIGARRPRARPAARSPCPPRCRARTPRASRHVPSWAARWKVAAQPRAPSIIASGSLRSPRTGRRPASRRPRPSCRSARARAPGHRRPRAGAPAARR